jgi:hypothetical protein
VKKNKAGGGRVLRFAIACVSLLVSNLIGAAEADEHKIPVFVAARTDGVTGERLAFALKEQIRASQSMTLVPIENAAAYQVLLSTMDMKDEYRTIYSVAWAFTSVPPGGLPSLADSRLGVCGEKVIDQCANTLVAQTGNWVDENAKALIKAFDEISKLSKEPEKKQR